MSQDPNLVIYLLAPASPPIALQVLLDRLSVRVLPLLNEDPCSVVVHLIKARVSKGFFPEPTVSVGETLEQQRHIAIGKPSSMRDLARPGKSEAKTEIWKVLNEEV